MVLDRVIGVINGDVLLESDVQDEMRFAVMQPYSVPNGDNSQLRAAQRLVNRTLILQQMNDPQQPVKVPEPSEKEVQQRIEELTQADTHLQALSLRNPRGLARFSRCEWIHRGAG